MGTEESASLTGDDLQDQLANALNESTSADDSATSNEQGAENVDDEAAPKETASGVTDTSNDDGGDAPAVPALIEPPVNWSEEDRNAFNGLSKHGDEGRQAQEFLMRIEKQFKRALTEKGQEAKTARDTYAPIDQILQPWKQHIGMQGMTEADFLRQITTAYASLLNNPAETIKYLAQWHGVNLSDLTSQTNSSDELYPESNKIKALTDKVGQLESFLKTQQTSQYQTQFQDAQSQIETFKNAKDQSGNLLHPHFDTVRKLMAGFVKDGTPIADAYEMATRAHPETARTVIETELSRRQKAEAEKRRQKAEAAKRAGKNIGGRISGDDTSNTRLSIEEELARAMGVSL